MAMLEDLNEKCGEVDDQKGSVQLCLLAPFPFLDPVLDPEYEDAEKCFGTIYDSMDGGIYSKIKTDEDRYCPEARRVGDICPDCWRKLIDGGQVNDGS